MSRPPSNREKTRLRGTLRQPFAIVGYIPFLGARGKVGSLLLALANHKGGFHYAGSVRTGFTGATRVQIGALLEMDHVAEPPVAYAPPLGNLERWALPKYVAEVEFAEWANDGQVRRPSFQRLCEGKKPSECVRIEQGKGLLQPRASDGLVVLDRFGRYPEIESPSGATEPAAE